MRYYVYYIQNGERKRLTIQKAFNCSDAHLQARAQLKNIEKIIGCEAVKDIYQHEEKSVIGKRF